MLWHKSDNYMNLVQNDFYAKIGVITFFKREKRKPVFTDE